MTEEILNQQEDEDAYRSNQLDPAPDEIDTSSNKSMWIINGYRIWADSYKQALELLPLIESI